MRLGLIARADNGGLGAQTFEMYRHLKPAKVMVVDISDLNGFNNHYDRYPGAQIVKGFPSVTDFAKFLTDIDVLITVEIPYGYVLFEMARARGVKTALQYNFEFLDYLQKPTYPAPDLFLAPSSWRIGEARELAESLGAQFRYIEVPVNRDVIPYRKRTEAKRFLHVAGHKTYEDRNGTQIVLEAMKLVKEDVELIITTQHGLADWIEDWESYQEFYTNVKVIERDFDNYWDIWNEIDADVLLLPRRYGGLSLQLNEAQAAGMPVLMSMADPQRNFLPDSAMVPYTEEKLIQTRTEIECYSVDPRRYAASIDMLASTPELVANLSDDSNRRAENISWKNLAPEYLATLEELCKPR